MIDVNEIVIDLNNTADLPVWELNDNVVFPTCKDLIPIHGFQDVELLSLTEKYGRHVFVVNRTVNMKLSGEQGDALAGMLGLSQANVTVPGCSMLVGTICEVKDVIRNEDEELFEVLLVAETRGVSYFQHAHKKGKIASVACIPEIVPKTQEQLQVCEIYRTRIVKLLEQYSRTYFKSLGKTKDISSISEEKDFYHFSYRAAKFAEFDAENAASVFLTPSVETRLGKLTELMNNEMQYLEISEKLLGEVQRTLSKQQKEMFLREQMRAIQSELGEDDFIEANELEDALLEIVQYLPKADAESLLKEVNRLKKMSPLSPEYQVVKSRLDLVVELPWGKAPEENISLAKIREILDRDHYAMEKVKDRIVEFMAVKTKKKATVSSILCLYGPPGTGKTSVVKSIAEALGRKYVRVSLGGVHDEAEIRGHRKTYVGAMQGRIISAMKNAGTTNPVILLDEIDKLSGDFRGDPSAALLEVLDREINKAFRDNYLEVPYDLSNVLFITTANDLDTIPGPLRDRLEIIELSSYTEDEKYNIAVRHLIPRNLIEHGLSKSAVKFNDAAILKLIREYTSEAGVRGLDRKIAAVVRKAICEMDESGKKSMSIGPDKVEKMLGAGRAIHRFATGENVTKVGEVNGMAWTSAGGVLLSVQANVFPGSGKVEITGSIGDVMKESVTAAISYLRSKAKEYGIPEDFYKTTDIHIHVPEGATPKDGPSAGVTIATAVYSALTGKKVLQSVAMTGEITIKGEVLAIGGLKEKSLAALKEGAKTVIAPKENAADIAELPAAVREGMTIIKAETLDDVLKVAIAG